MPHWFNRIQDILEADTADLRELAILAGGDPESFYIGTCIDGADLRGQNLLGMKFGSFNPASVVLDEHTQIEESLIAIPPAPQQVPSEDSVSAVSQERVQPFWAESELAIELDGAMTRIYRKGVGVVLQEPSIYAARRGEREPALASGAEALALVASSTVRGIHLVSPFRDGKLADERLGGTLMRSLLRKAIGRPRIGGAVITTVPSEATPVQRRAAMNVMKLAGAKQIGVLDRGIAAAIGAGLPVHEARASLVIDIGSVTTDVAVVCLSGTVISRTLDVGTSTMSAEIANSISRLYSVDISLDQAEQLRLEYGTARYSSTEGQSLLVRDSQSLKAGMREARVPVNVISGAMVEPISAIIDTVRMVIESIPPEPSVEIGEDGCTLTGVGATIRNLDAELRDHIGLKVHIAADPHLCVVLGCARVLEHPKWRKGVTGI